MSTEAGLQQGANGEEYPSWFSTYLSSLKPKKEERAAELDEVLQGYEDISTVFRSNVTAAYRAETRLESARKAEEESLTQQLLHNPIPYDAPYPDFPWQLISADQGKICSRISDDLKPLDFSSKSLRYWAEHFKSLYARKFVHDRCAKLALIYNSCSSPLQQQLLSLNVGSKAADNQFVYSELLQIICTLCNCPNHTELALQQLYGGLRQEGADSIPMFLEKCRSISEDAYGLASTWTMNQASIVIQRIVAGLKNRSLATLTSSIVITLPFSYNQFRDTVIQFESRLPPPSPAVHAVEVLSCWKCGGEHLQRDCKTLSCFRCNGPHKTANCRLPKSKLTCSKCSLKNHTTKAHRQLPGRSTPRADGEEIESSLVSPQLLHSLMVEYHSRMKVNHFLSIVNYLSIPERSCPPESPFWRISFFKGWGGTVEG